MPDSDVILISVYERIAETQSLSVWARRIALPDPVSFQRCLRWGVTQASMTLMFTESEEMWNAQKVAIPGGRYTEASCLRARNFPYGTTFEHEARRHGIELHDPDCRILSSGAVDALGWKRRKERRRTTIGRVPSKLPK